MATKIFKDIYEFWAREDRKLNGVSQEFANENPDYEKQNETNEGCWNCSDCSGCSRCSDCSDCSGCSDCSDCSRCSGCSDCSRCSRCSDCSGLKNASPVEQEQTSDDPRIAEVKIPVIENIHQKVLEAVTADTHKLNMSEWHTCDTTHCRAGWVVHIAGKDGYELEKKTSTLFAAQQIYHHSCPDVPVSPTRFYEPNEKAMSDIINCAEKEKALVNS